MSDWMPIESVPNDKIVLGLSPVYNNVLEVSFTPKSWWNQELGALPLTHPLTPTHWIPLPEKPKKKADMSDHTPGPWKYEVNRTCDGYEKHIIRSEAKLKPYESDWICACGGMKEGDGNLIAAAPKLLEACELALVSDDRAVEGFLRAAIAKAKGDQG